MADTNDVLGDDDTPPWLTATQEHEPQNIQPFVSISSRVLEPATGFGGRFSIHATNNVPLGPDGSAVRAISCHGHVIGGHLGWVRSLAFDPGNEWFCTGSADRTIKAHFLPSSLFKGAYEAISEEEKLKCLGHLLTQHPVKLLASVRYDRVTRGIDDQNSDGTDAYFAGFDLSMDTSAPTENDDEDVESMSALIHEAGGSRGLNCRRRRSKWRRCSAAQSKCSNSEIRKQEEQV